MTSDEYTNYIRSRINDSATGDDFWWYDPSFENSMDSGTSHVSLLGPDGSAAAITLTINFQSVFDFNLPDLKTFFEFKPTCIK